MPKVTADMTITLDGYGSGRGQSAEHPFGDLDHRRLHAWQFDHRDDNADEANAIVAAGAYVMGRNMFGPDRGEWDLDWTGWWGPNPPYHAPVFVLCHRPRPNVELDGGTTFHFVTEGIEAALEQARDAAATRTSRSPAAPARSTSTSPPAWSTSYASTSRHSSPAAASACSTASATST